MTLARDFRSADSYPRRLPSALLHKSSPPAFGGSSLPLFYLQTAYFVSGAEGIRTPDLRRAKAVRPFLMRPHLYACEAWVRRFRLIEGLRFSPVSGSVLLGLLQRLGNGHRVASAFAAAELHYMGFDPSALPKLLVVAELPEGSALV
jgi:hypothetical protein